MIGILKLNCVKPAVMCLKSSACSWALISEQRAGDMRSSCGTSLKSAVRSRAKHVAVQEDKRPPTRSEITIVRRAGQPAVLKRTIATVLFSTPRPVSLLYQRVSVRKFTAAAAVTRRPSVGVNAVIVRHVLLLNCQPLRVDCICCLQLGTCIGIVK